MSFKVTVKHSVLVRRSPEDVWDFTQDYTRRSGWDASVLRARVVVKAPTPRVEVQLRPSTTAVFQYRQYSRPVQASLVMEDTKSLLLEGGGGSWSYAPDDEGTIWTETNSLIVRSGWWRQLFFPLVEWQLKTSTRRAMNKAKDILEAGRDRNR